MPHTSPSTAEPGTDLGRWTIFVCSGCGGATGRHRDCDAKRFEMPVVPADEDAVDRLAQHLHDTDEDRVLSRDGYRERARACLAVLTAETHA